MSEQTIQNDLFSNNVTILDKYECLSLGATTIGDLIAGKRIVCNKVKTAIKNKGKKPDVLIVDGSRKAIAYIECKKPEEFNTDKKIEAAINQEVDVAKELGIKIFVATDGSKFVWINALTRQPILDEDANEIVTAIKPKNEERKIAKLIGRLTIDLSDSNNQLQQIKYSDPTNLAKKIGGLLKTIKFTTPKDSLYTFVELFLFKYLSDINILSSTENFDYILNLYGKDGRSEAEVLYRYIHEPREKISKLFPEAPDKTSLINGFVFHADKDADGNYISNNADATTFHEVIKLFKEYEDTDGKFIDINRDFKSKLFETFTKQEKTKENAGKYFTPLKIVKGMVDMVDIKEGDEICDPACGVGKFLLEAALKIDEPFTFKNGHVVKKIKLYGYEKAGACAESIHPFCTGTGSGSVWHGPDESTVFHHTGHCYNNLSQCKPVWRDGITAPGRDRGKGGIRRHAGFHPPVDRNPAWQPAHHGIVFYYDPDRLWADVQAVYVHCHCTHPPFNFCGGAVPIGREEFYPVLCGSVSGRGNHRTGLYHIFGVYIQHAGRVGYQPVSSNNRMELRGRAGV